jgi:hypothetical protein
MDPATTTKDTSNPTRDGNRVGRRRTLPAAGFDVEGAQGARGDRSPPATLRAIRSRPDGGPAQRFCLAATNERYFADITADDLRALVPTELVIESVSVQPPGYEEKITYKTWLGDLYSAAVNDNRYALPNSEYFKKDQRMTVKSAGRYDCVPDSADGAHGDSFVSGALAEYALNPLFGDFEFDAAEPEKATDPDDDEELNRAELSDGGRELQTW